MPLGCTAHSWEDDQRSIRDREGAIRTKWTRAEWAVTTHSDAARWAVTAHSFENLPAQSRSEATSALAVSASSRRFFAASTEARNAATRSTTSASFGASGSSASGTPSALLCTNDLQRLAIGVREVLRIEVAGQRIDEGLCHRDLCV